MLEAAHSPGRFSLEEKPLLRDAAGRPGEILPERSVLRSPMRRRGPALIVVPLSLRRTRRNAPSHSGALVRANFNRGRSFSRIRNHRSAAPLATFSQLWP